MLAFLTGGLSTILSTLVTGVVGPLFTYLGKKQDVTLEGFKTAAGVDQEAYKAALDHDVAIQQLKLQANGWWGPRVLYMIVGGSAALHTAAVFLDSTLTFGTGHYGNLGVPPLPGVYATFEQMVVGSLFVVSLVDKPINALTSAWMSRK